VIDASPESRPLDEATAFVSEIERVVGEEDLLPYLVLLEPLMRKAGAAQVAAALGLLLRRQGREAQSSRSEGAARSESVSRPPSWARLFLSVGEKDGITTRDLLGAIIGEAGVAGDEVGRIDLRETFAKVEVQEQVAERVIRALNGTSIRGRSVRADFDRGETTRSSSKGGDRGRGDKGRPGSKGEDRPRRAPSSGFRGPRPSGGERGKGGGSRPPSGKGKPEGGGKGRRSDSPKPRRSE
jgi:ATP-dependent RNA helicase DeaD